MLFASITIVSCNPNPQLDTIPSLVSTITPTPTNLPTHTPTRAPIATATICPPSPLGQELPLPNDVKEFIGRYYQTPGRIVKGMRFYFYVPIGLETETRGANLIVGDAVMGDRHMLWLEKRICFIKGTESTPQSYSYYQVVDVVELPRVENNSVVDLNTCLINGTLARRTMGLGEVTDENNAPSKPLYAWQVNVEDEKIVPISTQNMKCYFDFSYAKP